MRMVGSIADPAADDGLGLTGPGAPGLAPRAETTEHPVRARLIEKAREAEGFFESDPRSPPTDSPIHIPVADFVDPTVSVVSTRESPEPAPFSSSPPTPAPLAVASELDRIARRTQKLPEGPALSPNMIAVLGGLLGLTVICTVGVFLGGTRVQPPAPQQAEEEPSAAPLEKAEPEVPIPVRTKMEGPWRIADDAQKPGHRVIEGKIGKQAFLTAIQAAGLPKSEAYRAYGVLKDQLDLDRCKATDTFKALIHGSEKKLIAFEYMVTKEDIYQVKENAQGRLEAGKLDLKVARNQIRRAFLYDGTSFEDSARRAGFDPGISKTAEEALRGHSTLADLKRGDRFRVIAQEVTVLGEFSRYAGIEAMELLRPGEDPRRIYYFPHAVEGGYFDKSGKAPYEGGWRKPIPGAPRTSPFNPKRLHPVLKRVMPHNGTDYGAPSGTPIGATAPGTVTFIGMAGRSGNLVQVKHSGGYESGYAHLSRFVPGMKVGDSVERMQTVGYCGNTGSSTAPHLHFSMKKDGVFIDPESLNLDGLRVLPKAFRAEFEEVQSKYDPILDQIPLPEPLPLAEVTPVVSTPEQPAEVLAANGMMPDEPVPATAAATPPSATTPPPKATAPQPGAPAKPATPSAPSAIFLTDADLLKMQSATDDGEVNE
jgi:murein DD-endopeptidase MepM/ murein hydrolase activator NlpD